VLATVAARRKDVGGVGEAACSEFPLDATGLSSCPFILNLSISIHYGRSDPANNPR
jgi:hypothetical protein